MRPIRLAFLAPFLLAVAACSPLRALNVLVPERGFERTEGIAYGDDPRQRLDVYVPRDATKPAPVVVFYYGGGWEGGNRAEYLFAGEALASQGFVAVVPDYRLYPQVKLRGFMSDAAAAFAWTRREIARHGGDPTRIFVMGHSAGAHIAALLAYDERYLRAQGLGRDAIRGVIGIAGPYDFVPTDPDITALLSDGAGFEQGMPATFVRGGEPPTLLLTGGRDTRVGPENTDKLVARLRAAGSRVIDRRYPELNHSRILVGLSAPLRNEALIEPIATFVRETR